VPLPLAGLFGRITSQTASQSLGFGVGVGLAEALRPEATELGQIAWAARPIRVPDAVLLAEGVAQGQVDPDKARDWARSHGYEGETFDALVEVARTGPAIGMAMAARRRGKLTDGELRTTFERQGIEHRWFDAIADLVNERLDAGAIATAVHRGILAGAGLLLREPPLGEGKVPHVPQSDIDAVAEARAHGLDPERLRVLIGNTGLPPGVMEMLRLLNMGKVTADDVRRAVAQSNLRNEYMDVVLELRRQLPTARDYLENALRGYRTLGDAIEGAALHGMTAEDATMIYQNQGRPMNLHAITTALARGGVFKPEPGEITDPYRAAIVEGNLKPAYYDLAMANRYTLPGAFVLRGMAQAGELGRQETETLLLQSGWPPALAAKAAARWTSAAGASAKAATKAELETEYEGGYITADEYRAELAQLGYSGHALDLEVHLGEARRVKGYRDKAVDAVAKAFVAFKIDSTKATSELAELNIPADAQTLLLSLWDKQRLFSIRELTPAQIKKAFVRQLVSRADAIEALEWEHMTPTDAAIFLDE
jgi:hypothetical protein